MSDETTGVLGLLQRVFGRVRCDHPRLIIVGARDDLSAIYECQDCGQVVRPTERDEAYRSINDD